MREHSKIPLFLMELTLMLLVFTLSASVCLRVFAGARNISLESRELDRACGEAQRAAEFWQASRGDLQKTAQLLDAEEQAGEILLSYDGDWLPAEGEGIYTLRLQAEGSVAHITVEQGGKELFSLKSGAVTYGE